MKERERLQLVLWWCVMMIALVGLAFALGIWAGEKLAMEQTPPPVRVEGTTPPALSATSPDKGRLGTEDADCHGAKPLAMTVEYEEPLLDPLCEDSYLMPEHPLSLENQMLLYGACLEFQVDYALALAVVEQETGFRNVTGDDGDSVGFMQVQEKWHRERMTLLGVDDLKDPEGNFRVGCHFLRECIDKYGLEKGLGYYNSGRAAVTSYSREVLGRMEKNGM